MATLITKNSSTASSVPTAAQLVQGELAVNVTDKRLFTENSSGTVVELGTNPSTLALPNGTANGVAYLNGSKVLTTGSALTFDGSLFTVKPANTEFVVGSTFAKVENKAGASANLILADTTDSATLRNIGSSLAFLTSSSEQARLTSTGLGIGTSSPAQKLDVVGTIQSQNNAAVNDATVGAYNFLNSNSNAAANPIRASIVAGRENSAWGAYLDFYTSTGTSAQTAKMRLDTAGNLGLGVTPSAWRSNTPAFQVGASGGVSLFSDSGVAAAVGNNMYLNASSQYIYQRNDASSYYQQYQGSHSWYTAPSGTAGNTITFTQAMTLTAAGDLGIGTTSPAVKLDVAGAIQMSSSMRISGDAFVYSYNGGTGGQVRSGTYYEGTNQFVAFYTAQNERARITSGGDLLVGTTAAIASERFNVTGSVATNFVMRLSNSTATSPQGMTIFYSGASPNSSSAPFLYCYDTTTLRAEIRSNGGFANYSANDVNLSDRREKTNFAPAKDYLDTICAIPVQTFNYIDQSEDDPGLTLGVVAQDVQAVAPELVMESNWGTEDNPKMRLSIYQTDLQYALMKALQELKAEFDAYKATHP